ncbi:MAG: hypothetical protein ACMUIE_00630 [Thermoplasmatota archaeon]
MIRRSTIMVMAASMILMSGCFSILIYGAPTQSTRHSTDHLNAGYGKTVTIDGTITQGEWSDAGRLEFQFGEDIGEVFYKETGSNLLIATHFPEMNMIDLYFDVEHDGGTEPQDDDLYIHSSFAEWEGRGTGSDWDLYLDPRGWTMEGDPDYLTREFSISYDKLGLAPGRNSTIGFCILMMVMGYPTAAWPESGDMSAPDTWGDLFSSDGWSDGNTPPSLGNGICTPEKGTTDIQYEFSVVYLDEDGDPPVVSSLFVDSAEYKMECKGSDFQSGVEFLKAMELEPFDHSFYFLFSDGINEARLPKAGEFEGPTVSPSNEAPELVPGGIPDSFHSIMEGEKGCNDLMDLDHFFIDDRDIGSLHYEMAYQEDQEILEARIDRHYLDLYLKDDDWHGSLSFQVRAIDNGINGFPVELHEKSTLSNIFSILVHPNNDAPKFISIGDELVHDRTSISFEGENSAVQGTWFNKTILLEDPDMQYCGNESLLLRSGDNRVRIDPVEGTRDEFTLSFLPGNADVGEIETSLTVSDLAGSSSSMGFRIEVVNTNDPPSIKTVSMEGRRMLPIEGVFYLTGYDGLLEGSTARISLSAEDPDILIGEEDLLSFSIPENPDFASIDPISGEILLKPRQIDIGMHTFAVWITDLSGSGPDEIIRFSVEVRNVNDPPEHVVIILDDGRTDITEGFPVNVTCRFHDKDLDQGATEYHMVTWISDLDGPLGCGGSMMFADLSPGLHSISAVVSDSYGAWSSASVDIRVIERGDEADEDEEPLIEGSTQKGGSGMLGWVLISAIICLVIWISVIMIMIIRNDRRIDGDPGKRR